MTDEYRAIQALNWSLLKHMRDSPAHCLAAHDAVHVPSDAMLLGTLTHALLLEPQTVAARFEVVAGTRTAKLKAEAAAAGIELVRPQQMAAAEAMAAALLACPGLAEHLDGAVCEVPIVWQDEATGVLCKALADVLNVSTCALIDIKTTRSIDPRRFASQAASLGYHGQLAHYAAGVEAALGWRPEVIAIAAVESAPPYDAVLYLLDPDTAIAWGESERRALLDRYAQCLAADSWPGRFTEPQVLEMPSWADPDDDLDLDGLEYDHE